MNTLSVPTDQQFESFVNQIRQETANAGMRKLSSHFQFPITEAEGVFWTTRGWLWVLLDYKHESALRRLIKDNGVQTREIIGFAQKMRIKIREDLQLKINDNRSTLLSFESLLRVCRYSNAPMAQEIMDYMYAQEEWARLEKGVQQATGQSMAQLQGKPHSQPIDFKICGMRLDTFCTDDGQEGFVVDHLERVMRKRRGAIAYVARKFPQVGQHYRVMVQGELTRAKRLGLVPDSLNCCGLLMGAGLSPLARYMPSLPQREELRLAAERTFGCPGMELTAIGSC